MAVEGGLIAVELTATAFADNGAVVNIVGTVALVTMEQGAVLLPGQGITGAAVLVETVGALAFIGDKDIVVAAGADDDAVAGSEGAALLVLAVGAEEDVLSCPVVVASGLQMTGVIPHLSLNLTEMAWVADNRRQLTGLGVQLRVEEEVTLVLAIDDILAIAG